MKSLVPPAVALTFLVSACGGGTSDTVPLTGYSSNHPDPPAHEPSGRSESASPTREFSKSGKSK